MTATHEVVTFAGADGSPDRVELRCPATGVAAAWAPWAGMLGSSLRLGETELLHVPGGAAEYARTGSTRGVPLLAPWANRLDGWRYTAAGRTVVLEPGAPGIRTDEHDLPIHGLLAAARGWEVLETGADAAGARLVAGYDLAEHPELLRSFPFAHRLRYAATVARSTVRVAVTLEAGPDGPVPVSFGFHPYLRVPGPRAAWTIASTMRSHLAVDDRGIPTGERAAVTDLAPRPLGARTWDDGFAGVGDPPQFWLRGGGVELTVTLESGYPYAQLYAPPNSPFVCFEPMTAPTAALSGDGRALPVVPAGGRFTATFSITIAAVPAAQEEMP